MKVFVFMILLFNLSCTESKPYVFTADIPFGIIKKKELCRPLAKFSQAFIKDNCFENSVGYQCHGSENYYLFVFDSKDSCEKGMAVASWTVFEPNIEKLKNK